MPEAKGIMEEEEVHERRLAEMVDEERLKYIGSMVLGLNDALVELTGALAGFTLALGSNATVGLAGFTFDPASGACQMSYTADTAQLTGSRTVKVSLSPESGYRGGASMSYRI